VSGEIDFSPIDAFREVWKRLERWKHNEKVRKKRYGYRFSPVWEFEKYARTNLKFSSFLYHGTQERKLNEILKDKTLKPNRDTGRVNYVDLAHSGSVYFTTNKGLASLFAYNNTETSKAFENWSVRACKKNAIRLNLFRHEKAFVIAVPKRLLAHRLKIDENLQSEGESFRIEGPIRLNLECTIEEVKEYPSND
jgi:hypothetical protein